MLQKAQLVSLNAVSYLAPNWMEHYQAIARSISRMLQCEIQLSASDRQPLDDLQKRQVDLAFICGLPFIRNCRIAPGQLRAIAAPIMQADRYQNRPVYFSDIIVRADSPFHCFSDLAGSTVCYNDPGSNSGYYLLRYRLLQEHSTHFFRQAVQSGSHQTSIRWVIEGKADCAAIDSTVLEQELRVFPELAAQIRIVESSDPCPMPPIVVSQQLGEDLIDQIQATLLQPDAELKAAMTRMNVSRYAAVTTQYYDAIAKIYDTVINSRFSQL
ncbi:PhnD/SsuA/transferrin family substrate-binding protein [Cyanobacteria bacterium FACHB-63]|nr:PhnD/SsuA/transferrin family substrate-binding protein [Cyanobacteria bacterium FACHB-63]